MATKVRGRPPGTSPNKGVDNPILKKAALLLITGRARSPTQAFRDVLGTDEEGPVIRRLQRRWHRDGERIVAELRAPMWERRWEKELAELKQATPAVHATIRSFAGSEGGSKLLAEHLGSRPISQMMSLGIVKLWELVEKHAPVGAAAADRAFTRQSWWNFGIAPDAAFLKQFASRCLERAEELDDAVELNVSSDPRKEGQS